LRAQGQIKDFLKSEVVPNGTSEGVLIGIVFSSLSFGDEQCDTFRVSVAGRKANSALYFIYRKTEINVRTCAHGVINIHGHSCTNTFFTIRLRIYNCISIIGNINKAEKANEGERVKCIESKTPVLLVCGTKIWIPLIYIEWITVIWKWL
jgi:hypothetical protein